MAKETLHRKVLMVVWASVVGFQAFGQTWPNEPASVAPLLDFSFQTMQDSKLIFYGGNAQLQSDNSAPFSSPSYVRYSYPVGFPGGIAAAKHYAGINGPKEIYVGYWIRISNPWQGHPSNVNKIMFLLGAPATGNTIMMFWGALPPYHLMIAVQHVTCNSHLSNSFGDACGTRQVFGNVGSGEISLGQWHRVELYQKLSTTLTSQDGILRWWLDGQLVGNHMNANLAGPQVEFQLDPTWGGTGETKTENDWIDFDHVHVSLPNGDGGFVNPLLITTGSLPSAASGKPYSATLQATGGKAPYGWTVISGSLHQGLTLNKTTGVISGTPTSCGRRDFTVKVMDSNVPPKEATKNLTIIASGTCTSIMEENKRLTVNGSPLTVESRTGNVLFRVQQNDGYSLRVYDLSGKMVQAYKGQGQNEIETALGNGIYFAKLVQEGQVNTIRFKVLR